MSEIEYVFGTGAGAPHPWSSPADLSLGGAPDAVRLDFDGDGLLDDALWDADRDGVAELAALDLTGDGVLDHFYTDPTGLGTWNHQVTGLPADAVAEPLGWTVRVEPESQDVLTGEPEGRGIAVAPAPAARPDISWPASPCSLAPQPGADPPPPPHSPALAEPPLLGAPRPVPAAP